MSQRVAESKKNIIFLLKIFCIISLSLVVGCATTPKLLKPEASDKIQKLAIVMVLRNNELIVFDHTDIWDKTYGGFMFGLIGALTESMVLAVEANIRKRISLGGDPDLLKEQLGEYMIEEILEEKISQKLSEKYEITKANHYGELSNTKKDQSSIIEDYLNICKKLEADTLLEVDFYYGLAAYAVEKASAVIIAKISVYDVYKENLIMRKKFISDEYFKKSRIVPDFAANNAALYKQDMLEIVNGFTQLVALDFGLKVDEGFKFKREFDDQISALTTTCKKPYKLDQDCSSWSGAKRTIKINEKEIKVAGSTDGKIILIMDKQFVPDDARLSSCFQLVKEKLLSNGIGIIKVTKLVTGKKDYGYILELNGDGYSILKNYTVKKVEETDQTSTID